MNIFAKHKLNILILILLCLIISLKVPNSTDPDIWWHLKTGEIIESSKSIPLTDIYSYTAFGHNWTNHEWLSQVLLFQIYKNFGWLGLKIFSTLSLCTIVVLIYLSCTRISSPVLGLTSAILASSILSQFVTNKPVTIAYLCSSIFLYILTLPNHATRKKHLLLLTITSLIWTNSHATSVYFIPIFTLLLWRRLSRKLPLLFILLSLVATPNSLRLFSYAAIHAIRARSFSPIITNDWRPLLVYPRLDTLAFLPYVFITGVAFFLLAKSLINAKGNIRLPVSIALILSAGLLSRKNVPFSTIFSFPLLSYYLLSSKTFNLHKYFTWLLILLLALVIGNLGFRKHDLKQELSNPEFRQPAKATDFALSRLNLSGYNTFTPYNWSGYLIYKGYSRGFRSLYDQRIEMFSNEILSDMQDIAYDPGLSPSLITKYNINLVITESISLLAGMLSKNPDWSLIYLDNQAAIFTLTSLNHSLYAYKFNPIITDPQAISLDKVPSAIAEYEILTSQSHQSPQVVSDLGQLYLRIDNLAKAKTYLLQALKDNPLMPPTYQALKTVYDELGETEESQTIEEILKKIEIK